MSSAYDSSLPPEDEDLEVLENEEELPLEDEAPVSLEDRARAMGWKPLPEDAAHPQRHEYRGDPRRWTDAAEFIAHGEAELPILRDQNRRMSERLARTDGELTTLRNTVTEQKAAMAEAVRLAKRADERGYNRGLAELKAKQREAVGLGDQEAFDQVQEQIDAMAAQRALDEPAPTPRVETPPATTPAQAPEIAAFVRDNPWFVDRARPHLQAAMIGMHNAVIAESPTMPLADQLEAALIKMETAFPEIIPEGEVEPMRQPAPTPRPRRSAAPVLAPSGGTPQRRPVASPLDRIQDPAERAEARKGFESMKRQDAAFTEAEYMAIYDDPHTDVLELRRQRK